MRKSRLEAFSDGVLAIIITIMVLELRPPEASWHALTEMKFKFLSYVISFLMLGIYWGNHHHLLHTIKDVNSGIMWANLHLLFWLSLIPFTTAWMGENHFTTWPVALYGIILLMAGAAYYILARSLISLHGKNSAIAKAIGKDRKGIISEVFYFAGIVLAFINPWIGLSCYFVVTSIWLIPDRRIEKKLVNEE